MNDPFSNLYDIAGLLMIATVLAFVIWLAGDIITFASVVVVLVLFIAACFFAKRGGR